MNDSWSGSSNTVCSNDSIIISNLSRKRKTKGSIELSPKEKQELQSNDYNDLALEREVDEEQLQELLSQRKKLKQELAVLNQERAVLKRRLQYLEEIGGTYSSPTSSLTNSRSAGVTSAGETIKTIEVHSDEKSTTVVREEATATVVTAATSETDVRPQNNASQGFVPTDG